MNIKPMRGCKVDLTKLVYPCYASPKIDGLRGMCMDGVVYSKSMKPLPNEYLQKVLGHPALHGFDGELCAGEPMDPNLMQQSMSAFMSRGGEPSFTYQVFDLWDLPDEVYGDRYKELVSRWYNLPEELKRIVFIVEPYTVQHQEELEDYEKVCLDLGYEGVMLRGIDSLYKYGTSTHKEQYLMKMKRWEDSEFVITDMTPLYRNKNEAYTNEVGNTQRSTSQSGLVPTELVGTLTGNDLHTGQEVNVGSGMTALQRKEFYRMYTEGKLQGLIATYKHFGVTGVKEGRRFGIFKSLRHPDDISKDS